MSNNSYPYIMNSWIILSKDIFIKKMDKSTFNHHGTGIPKRIQREWCVDTMEASSNQAVELLYNDFKYKAYIYCDPLLRTRLHWYADFKNVIHEKYIELAFQYKSEDEVEISPQMHFRRISKHKYVVHFVDVAEDSPETSKENFSDYNVNYKEGKSYYIYSKRYERDSKLRKHAIAIHGHKCRVCGFEFEEKYGEWGKGYIEIHHLKPLFINASEVNVNVEEDLVPLCSNCHRMVHRKRTAPLSLETLKSKMQNRVTDSRS